MDYPRVLGASIKVMPTKKRSIEWFNQQPEPIRRQFWDTLAKFSAFVAAEYLRNNSVVVEPLATVPKALSKDQDAKIVKAFSQPLTVSGTVVGQMWPTGINFLLPLPRYYSYRSFTDNWAFLSVVTTCKGDRTTYPSCDSAIASQKALRCARRYARAGHAIGHIKVELFELRLEQIEMIGKTRKCA